MSNTNKNDDLKQSNWFSAIKKYKYNKATSTIQQNQSADQNKTVKSPKVFKSGDIYYDGDKLIGTVISSDTDSITNDPYVWVSNGNGWNQPVKPYNIPIYKNDNYYSNINSWSPSWPNNNYANTVYYTPKRTFSNIINHIKNYEIHGPQDVPLFAIFAILHERNFECGADIEELTYSKYRIDGELQSKKYKILYDFWRKNPEEPIEKLLPPEIIALYYTVKHQDIKVEPHISHLYVNTKIHNLMCQQQKLPTKFLLKEQIINNRKYREVQKVMWDYMRGDYMKYIHKTSIEIKPPKTNQTPDPAQ